jgi:hypothetical protein
MVSPTPAGQALLDSFDSIRIINLVDRADRRREMAQQFARLGLSLDHPKIALFGAQRFTDPAGFPTPGTRGCFDSHYQLLREAADEGLGSILILEDDTNFDDEIETLLPPVLNALAAQEWDIFHGSLLPGHYESSVAPVELVGPTVDLRGTHFLAWRGAAIRHGADYFEAMAARPPLPAHPDGVPMHYDGAMSLYRARNPDVRTLIAHPDLGHQRLSRTDIHAPAFYDRLPVLKQAAGLARQIIKLTGRTKQVRR